MQVVIHGSVSSIERLRVNECTVGELIRVLLNRIKITNGLEFVPQEDQRALLNALRLD